MYLNQFSVDSCGAVEFGVVDFSSHKIKFQLKRQSTSTTPSIISVYWVKIFGEHLNIIRESGIETLLLDSTLERMITKSESLYVLYDQE